MVISLFLSPSTAIIFFFCEAAAPMVTTKAATIPMIAMTVSNSISVNASLERLCSNAVVPLVFIGAWLSIGRTRSYFLLAHLLFHALAEPLLDHALVIEVARTGQTLDARQHARVDSESDRDRIGQFTAHRRDGGP